MSAIERGALLQALELGIQTALAFGHPSRLGPMAEGELLALRMVARLLDITEIDARITLLLEEDRRAGMKELHDAVYPAPR